MEMILSSLCYDMLNSQLIPPLPLRYGVNASTVIILWLLPLPILSQPLKICCQCYKICCPCHSSAPNARCWPVSRHQPPQPPQPPTILGLLRPPANRGPGGSPPPMGGEAASWPPQPANHRPALTSPGWPGSFGLCCNLHLFSGHLHCSSSFLCFLTIFKAIPWNDRMKDCLMFNLEYLCDSYSTVNHTKVEMETIPINITPNVQQSVQKISVLCWNGNNSAGQLWDAVLVNITVQGYFFDIFRWF